MLVLAILHEIQWKKSLNISKLKPLISVNWKLFWIKSIKVTIISQYDSKFSSAKTASCPILCWRHCKWGSAQLTKWQASWGSRERMHHGDSYISSLNQKSLSLTLSPYSLSLSVLRPLTFFVVHSVVWAACVVNTSGFDSSDKSQLSMANRAIQSTWWGAEQVEVLNKIKGNMFRTNGNAALVLVV